MTREQKTKSKVSQARNARSKKGAVAGQVPNTIQAIADTANVSSVTISTQQGQGEVSPPLLQGIVPVDKPSTVQQSATSDLQAVWTGVQPSWPSWPTSKPGPRSTPPAPGTRSINRFRSEQLEEVGYNQQAGEPVTQSPFRSLPDERRTGPTSFDQPTAQDAVGKRKQRL